MDIQSRENRALAQEARKFARQTQHNKANGRKRERERERVKEGGSKRHGREKRARW